MQWWNAWGKKKKKKKQQPSGRPRKKEDAPINQPLRVPPAPPLPPQLTDVAPAIDLPTAVIIQFKVCNLFFEKKQTYFGRN